MQPVKQLPLTIILCLCDGYLCYRGSLWGPSFLVLDEWVSLDTVCSHWAFLLKFVAISFSPNCAEQYINVLSYLTHLMFQEPQKWISYLMAKEEAKNAANMQKMGEKNAGSLINPLRALSLIDEVGALETFIFRWFITPFSSFWLLFPREHVPYSAQFLHCRFCRTMQYW